MDSSTILQNLNLMLKNTIGFFYIYTIALNLFSSVLTVLDLAFLLNEKVFVSKLLIQNPTLLIILTNHTVIFPTEDGETFLYFLCCISSISKCSPDSFVQSPHLRERIYVSLEHRQKTKNSATVFLLPSPFTFI